MIPATSAPEKALSTKEGLKKLRCLRLPLPTSVALAVLGDQYPQGVKSRTASFLQDEQVVDAQRFFPMNWAGPARLHAEHPISLRFLGPLPSHQPESPAKKE
jgi:hypothetical protein